MSAIIIRGKDIRRARKARGMTQTDLAKLVGRSTGTVSQWEKGTSEVGPEAAKRLALWLAQKPEPVSEHGTATSPATCSISLPPKLAEIASELGVDIADLYATVGTEAVREELKRLWKEANAEAIRQKNECYEKNGLPLAEYRTRYWR
jgi:transcriptional regulator with XRE-family HTH domain